MCDDATMTRNDDELVPIRTTWRAELRKWWLACWWLVFLIVLSTVAAGAFWTGAQIGEWLRS